MSISVRQNFKIMALGIISLVVVACSDDSNDDVKPAVLSLKFSQTKSFDFSWTDIPDATHYRVMENPDGASGYTQIGSDIKKGVQSYKHIMPLHLRANASYILKSCAADCCFDSDAVTVDAALLKNSIGYFKGSNTETGDQFGRSVAISGDGTTLAVGAYYEFSNAIGIDGDGDNNSAVGAGAVYAYSRTGTTWTQQAYIKASNAEKDDWFYGVALSGDGNTLAVGSTW